MTITGPAFKILMNVGSIIKIKQQLALTLKYWQLLVLPLEYWQLSVQPSVSSLLSPWWRIVLVALVSKIRFVFNDQNMKIINKHVCKEQWNNHNTKLKIRVRIWYYLEMKHISKKMILEWNWKIFHHSYIPHWTHDWTNNENTDLLFIIFLHWASVSREYLLHQFTQQILQTFTTEIKHKQASAIDTTTRHPSYKHLFIYLFQNSSGNWHAWSLGYIILTDVLRCNHFDNFYQIICNYLRKLGTKIVSK